jgi:holo-[acyl-carrier protein] synthase
MDIVGIGTDIVECLRIGRMIERHGELFLRRIYTEREISYCQHCEHAVEHFAARWAAKEAIRKCLGTAWSRGLGWTDVEIRTDPTGQPHVHVRGGVKDRVQQLHIADILITLAHCRAYATAYALAVRHCPPASPNAET